MNIRLAERKDFDQLIQMRWDFTIEDYETKSFGENEMDSFKLECQTFLENALNSGNWFIWVAEEDEKIVSHIYIELIQKVPRPGRITFPFAYMTNVYTIKKYRSKGIGSKLMKTIHEWVKENKYEFIIVWPSDASRNYYERNGYKLCNDPMEFFY